MDEKYNLQKLMKFLVFSFGFALCTLRFASPCYALDLDKLKSSFLSGDYKSAISEGEKLLAKADSPFGIDELYYILGLSYLKDGNYFRASDIFEIILNEYKRSDFKEKARLSLGDVYFLRGNFEKAKACYEELVNSNLNNELKPEVYLRLSQAGFKTGDLEEAEGYLAKLKQEFPAYASLMDNKDTHLSGPLDYYYTVQVGAFSNIANARNLTEKLVKKGYPAYMEEERSDNKTSYRVKVGKSGLRQEIAELEKRLAQEGYPTKICP